VWTVVVLAVVLFFGGLATFGILGLLLLRRIGRTPQRWETSLFGVVWLFLIVAANFLGPVYIFDFLAVLLGAVTLGILALSGKI
jgi:hypothetical protein